MFSGKISFSLVLKIVLFTSLLGFETVCLASNSKKDLPLYPKTQDTPNVCFLFLEKGALATSSKLKLFQKAFKKHLEQIKQHQDSINKNNREFFQKETSYQYGTVPLKIRFSEKSMGQVEAAIKALRFYHLEKGTEPFLSLPDAFGKRDLVIAPTLLEDILHYLPEFEWIDRDSLKSLTYANPDLDLSTLDKPKSLKHPKREDESSDEAYRQKLLEYAEEVGSFRYLGQEVSNEDAKWVYENTKNWVLKLNILNDVKYSRPDYEIEGYKYSVVSDSKRASWEIHFNELKSEVENEISLVDESRIRHYLPHEAPLDQIDNTLELLKKLKMKFTGINTLHLIAVAEEHLEAQKHDREVDENQIVKNSPLWHEVYRLRNRGELVEMGRVFDGYIDVKKYGLDVNEQLLDKDEAVYFIKDSYKTHPEAALVVMEVANIMHGFSGSTNESIKTITTHLADYSRGQLAKAIQFAKLNPRQFNSKQVESVQLLITDAMIRFLGEAGNAADIPQLQMLKDLTLVHDDSIHDTSSHDRIYPCCAAHFSIYELKQRLQKKEDQN